MAPVLWCHKELFMTERLTTQGGRKPAAVGIIDLSPFSKNLCIVGKMKHEQLQSEVQKVK